MPEAVRNPQAGALGHSVCRNPAMGPQPKDVPCASAGNHIPPGTACMAAHTLSGVGHCTKQSRTTKARWQPTGGLLGNTLHVRHPPVQGYAIRVPICAKPHSLAVQAAPGPPLKFLRVLLEVLGPNGVVDVILRVPTRLPLKAPGQQVGIVHVAQQVCSRVAGAG